MPAEHAERGLEPDEAVRYPGARAPERTRLVRSHGIGLSVHEWGDAAAPPLVLAHGGFDFARTFDVFGPMLADAGWRVVAWDQRGHGDSEHAALYSWEADMRDAVAVLDSLGPEPVPVVGHSKGGAVMVHLAATLPQRVSRLVNLDGLPSRRNMPDLSTRQRARFLAGEVASWLDFRRGTSEAVRKPGTIDELAERRARMNTRLPWPWLRYLVTVGGRRDPDGWRWKIDPSLRLGRFGPWRPEWAMARLPGLSVPLLAVLGLQPEEMGWGTLPEDVEPHLAPGGRVEALEDAGHFLHIEQPRRVADVVLDFLGSPSGRSRGHGGAGGGRGRETVTLRHNRVELALHRLCDRPGPPLLVLHGLGERSPDRLPHPLDGWSGPVWALDFTGHGASTVPAGGGYSPELLMGDVDAALAYLGPATLYGRGLGGYVGLLAAGGRPDLVRGVIIDDGPGLAGGGSEPGSAFALQQPLASSGPDPYALLELTADARPAEYVRSYVHQATGPPGTDLAVAVCAVVHPPWLAAVLTEPRVRRLPLPDALAQLAAA